MIALPSCEALEVGDRLIPLVRDAIRSIDVEARVIDVDLALPGRMSIDVFTLFPEWFDWFRGSATCATRSRWATRSRPSTCARRRR